VKCIIIGAGKVGYSIAATLSEERHEVTVIDVDGSRLENLEEHLDVHVIEGNGAQMNILQEAGAGQADLLVAVTEMDELNMVACFIAKSLGVKSTVARVRDPGYAPLDSSNRQTALGIDLIINPERVTAQEIAKLISFPEAYNVAYYADGRVQLLELELKYNSPVIGHTLLELEFPHPCVIVAIIRDDAIIIPCGKDRLLSGDLIFILAASKDILDLESYLGISRSHINHVTILGGGLLGYYLVTMLEKTKRRLNVKLIESDPERCDELAESLNHTLIIHGNGTDLALMEDENVGEMDVFIAVTDDDKENLLACILAKYLGAKKTISQIRRSDFVSMVEKVGIDRAVSPRNLMVANILKFIGKGNIISLTIFDEERAQMAELVIPSNAKVVGKTLRQLSFPPHAIIGIMVRGKNVIVPTGQDVILAGDRVIVFALPHTIRQVEEFLTK